MLAFAAVVDGIVMRHELAEDCLGVGGVRHWVELVRVPDEVEIVAWHEEGVRVLRL